MITINRILMIQVDILIITLHAIDVMQNGIAIIINLGSLVILHIMNTMGNMNHIHTRYLGVQSGISITNILPSKSYPFRNVLI